jgi:hypothetical protein
LIARAGPIAEARFPGRKLVSISYCTDKLTPGSEEVFGKETSRLTASRPVLGKIYPEVMPDLY